MTSSTRSEKAHLRVVLDTNIIVSALIYKGLPARVLELFENNQIEITISPEIELEVFTVLARFSVDKITVSSLQSLLEQKAIRVVPTTKVTVCRDPKDNMLLGACGKSRADFLVTGDRDLLTLKIFKSTKIVTPKEFLKLLE